MKTEVTQVTEHLELKERVLNKVTELRNDGLMLPKNYSPRNAIDSAWLIISSETTGRDKVPLLSAITDKSSIASVLFNMVIMGLSPHKDQCYFILRAGKLTLFIGEYGDMAIAERMGIKTRARVIYEDDDFDYIVEPNGRMYLKNHTQSFKSVSRHFEVLNKDTKDAEYNQWGTIVGAYAIAEHLDGSLDMDVMSFPEILISWGQSPMGIGNTHKKFTGEMAKRSVTRRLLKPFLNSSDDSSLHHAITYSEPAIDTDVAHEVETNANKEMIGFEDAEIEEPAPVTEAKTKVESKEEGPGF